jgi:peptide/nickel transport system permease protein
MATDAETVDLPSRRERFVSVVSQLRNNRNAVIGIALLVPIVVAIVAAPVLAPYDPTAQHTNDRFEAPSSEYLLGTDQYGRDLLSRTLFGGQTSLLLGVAGASLAVMIGTPIGLSAGYFGGRTDELLMRGMDVLMSIPPLILALLMVIALSPNIWNIVIAVGIVFSPGVSRVVRSRTLSVKQSEFVKAAQARGEPSHYTIFREIFPNTLDIILIEGSIRIGYGILLGTSLSFLGMGTQPPAADWGYMISVSRGYLWSTPYYLLWPTIALGLTILGFNLLGDGLRDVLDPKMQEEK